MKYTKESLSFEQQADLLIRRGLLGERDQIIQRLEAVNYYRLSAYWHTFRIPDDKNEQLRDDTTLDMVWRRYRFDRQLRLLVMDAIERVEISIRTHIVNRHVMMHGPFGYLDGTTLPGLRGASHEKLLSKIRKEAEHSHEEFVRHYFSRYTSEKDLPLWMACELLTFGGMLTLFHGLNTKFKKEVAQAYGLNVPVIGSWLKALNQVRNTCAHHSRLWNRQFGIKPMIPFREKFPEWHEPVQINDERLFGILTILQYLLKQTAPQTEWSQRLKALLDQYNDVPKRFMGIPDNWLESPIWE
jgi:abortive infection bacteriophage resistance protein